MIIGTTLLIVGILVVGIWIIIEFKRFKHKLLAIFLILLIVFTYVSFLVTLKGKDIDFKSVEGLKQAGTLYFSWLGSVFGNLKTITSNAIKMDWSVDENLSNTTLLPKELPDLPEIVDGTVE
jgi:glucan phosphoethanolaminetransferase (alkaline phosphatase superfamily)